MLRCGVVAPSEVEGEIILSYPVSWHPGDLAHLLNSLVVAQRGNSVYQNLGRMDRQLPKWRNGLCLDPEYRVIWGVVHESSEICV